MTRYYIDVTKTLEFGLQTGIQRVVRQIATRLPAILETAGDEAVPVIALAGRFRALTPSGLAALASTAQAPVSGPRRVTGAWRSVLSEGLKRVPILHAAVLEHLTNRRMKTQHAALFQPEPVSPAPDDRLVLLDLLFGGSPALRAARRWDGPVVAVIYDLIPITHPQYMPRLVRHSFRRSFIQMVDEASAILTISAFCAGEIRRFAAARGRALPVHHFYLGYDLPGVAESDRTDLLPAVLRDPQAGPMFLMLGSLEARKGHALVLAAFEQRWAQGSRQALVICGREGWDMAALAAHLRAHPEAGKRLHWFENADDAMVAAIIQRAEAMIVASRVEGFGLPIVEALGEGLPVLAADIPVFREIAGDHAEYFDPDDPAVLATLLAGFARAREQYRQRAASFGWIDWDEAALAFRDALQAALLEAHGQ